MSCKRLRVIRQRSPVTRPGCAAAFGASSAAHTQSEPWADHHDLSPFSASVSSPRERWISKCCEWPYPRSPGTRVEHPHTHTHTHTHTHVLSNVRKVPKSFPHRRRCLWIGIKMSFHLSTLCFYSLSLCLLLFYLSPLSLSCPLPVSPSGLNVLFVSNLPAPPSPPLHHPISTIISLSLSLSRSLSLSPHRLTLSNYMSTFFNHTVTNYLTN